MLSSRFLLLILSTLFLAAQPAVEARLRWDVAWLADPARQGRGDGDPGLEEAASFLVRRYEALGLKPTIHRFPFLARISRKEASATMGHGDQAMEILAWGKDVEALGSSGNGSFQHKALAFLGFGLQAAVHDDFQAMELKGRVAMILRTVPNKAPFDHLTATDRALSTRIKQLVDGGVAAVVVLEEGEKAERLRLDERGTVHRVPILSMPVRVPAKMCADLPQRIARLRETGEPQSRDYVLAPWSFLSLKLSLNREEVQIPNVMATIPGKAASKRDEHIVLGAHFDHLGLGERHSLGEEGSVHPGADDNASGTAMVLELARRLKANPPQRSVTILHFSGEEEGLLGSAKWVGQPTIPLASIKAMLNFDMVGRMQSVDPMLYLGGLGMPPSGMAAAKALLPKGMNLGQDLGPALGASDHVSFAMAKIPTFFFFTGLHSDYHRPSDTSDKILTRGMAKIANFAFRITQDLGNSAQTPPFDPATAVLPASLRGIGSKVRFGTLPDYQPHKDGFRINGVSPGSTAEQVGLKAGDILTDFGGHPLRSIQDFMDALSAQVPGDTIRVKWLRAGRPMEAEALLRGRE